VESGRTIVRPPRSRRPGLQRPQWRRGGRSPNTKKSGRSRRRRRARRR